MLRIKRTKGSATHYAISVAKLGNVTGWTLDKDKARAVTGEEAEKVKAFHAALDDGQRRSAGQLDFEPVSEAEIKAVLDLKMEQESTQLARLIDAAVAPIKKQLGQLETMVQVLWPKQDPSRKPAEPAASVPSAAGLEKKSAK